MYTDGSSHEVYKEVEKLNPCPITSLGKLVSYDADGDGDFDVEDAKVLLGKLN